MENARKVGIEGYCCYLVVEQGEEEEEEERRVEGEKKELLD